MRQKALSFSIGASLLMIGLVIGHFTQKVQADGIPTEKEGGVLFYSGTLEKKSGEALKGDQNMSLKLWDKQSGGADKCTTPLRKVTVDQKGRFRLKLSETCVQAVQKNPNLWVELTVEDGGGNVTLPRTKIGAVPYAVEAKRATEALKLKNRPMVRYSSLKNTEIKTGTNTKLHFSTKQFDTHSAVTTSGDWVFTAPEAGIYKVTASIALLQSSAWDGAKTIGIALYKEGIAYSWLNKLAPRSGTQPHLRGSDLIQLKQGEKLTIVAQQNSGSTITADKDKFLSYIAIHRVD